MLELQLHTEGSEIHVLLWILLPPLLGSSPPTHMWFSFVSLLLILLK